MDGRWRSMNRGRRDEWEVEAIRIEEMEKRKRGTKGKVAGLWLIREGREEGTKETKRGS